MTDTPKTRRILVVDDYEYEMDALSNAFDAAKENGFANWTSDPEMQAVLGSMGLEKLHNDNLADDDGMGVIIEEMLKTPYDGIISDMGMLTSIRQGQALFSAHPNDAEKHFIDDPSALKGGHGGAELAKIANLKGTPLVIYSLAPNEAANILKNEHLKYRNPAKAKTYRKNDYSNIFLGLASEIMEKEAAQGVGR